MNRTIRVFVSLFIIAGLIPFLIPRSPRTFAQNGNLIMARQTQTATLPTNGRVLVAGRFLVPPPFSVGDSAELYDPSTGTFIATGSLNVPRSGHSSTLLPKGQALVARSNDIGRASKRSHNRCAVRSEAKYET